jgi:hypothetical protein
LGAPPSRRICFCHKRSILIRKYPPAEPIFSVFNNPGHKAWFEDSYKCFEYWQKSGSACGVCLASCPYTKGDQAWIHEGVKATVSIAPATDGIFRIMDNVFGYGKQHDPEQWWTKDTLSGRRG